MPALHVLSVGAQIGAGIEEAIVEIEIEMVRLDVVEDEHGRHGAGGAVRPLPAESVSVIW